jgi:predicted nucleic acid-binding protein
VIYLDTGAFLARYLARDQHHKKAVAAWSEIGRGGLRCFTSNFVLDETLTLLGRRAGYRFAAQRARLLYASRILTILRPGREDELEAVEDFEKFADQKVSFTDCISWILMRRNKLRRAFSFDEHFQMAGFELWP